MIRQLPNAITCANLLCGCAGIVSVFNGHPTHAAYFAWMAGLFDFFDGFAARLLKVNSPLGKELDSLADVVSFGVLPSMVMYTWWPEGSHVLLSYTSFGIAAFSALRLAIFNLDHTQSDSFKGLPTPANALLLTSLPLLPQSVTAVLQQPVILVLITVASCYLLVSPHRLFALKFKSFGWKGNEIRFTFLLVSVLLIILLQLSAIPMVILLYIAVSLVHQTLQKHS
jgi:CDP-diacylglycerol--serine O-phosphatidyltransferase